MSRYTEDELIDFILGLDDEGFEELDKVFLEDGVNRLHDNRPGYQGGLVTFTEDDLDDSKPDRHSRLIRRGEI